MTFMFFYIKCSHCLCSLCSHRGPEDYWTQNATIEDWFDEFVGQANIINRFGGVRMEDLWGECTNMIQYCAQ